MDIKDSFYKFKESGMSILFARIHGETKENVLELLRQKEDYYVRVLVGEETDAERPHCHILAYCRDESKKNVKQNFRNYIKSKLTLSGNADYSITETNVDNKNKIGSYVVKEGNYAYYGFSKEDIDNFVKLSYKPYSGKKFQDAINDINETYITGDRTSKWWFEQYIELKKSYNQRISIRQSVDLFNLVYCKRNGNLEVVNSCECLFLRQFD